MNPEKPSAEKEMSKELPPKEEQLEKIKKDWNVRFLEDKRWEDREPDQPIIDIINKYESELGKKVLDLGCGNGRHLIPLVERGFEVTGLDISEEGLKQAKKRLKQKNLSARLIKGSTTELPFEENNFDSVISVGVLHHGDWNMINESFRETARVLKPEGKFILMVRSKKDQPEGEEIKFSDKGRTSIHKGSRYKEDVLQHYFSIQELEELANEYGFDFLEEPDEQKKKVTKKGRERWRTYMVMKKRTL